MGARSADTYIRVQRWGHCWQILTSDCKDGGTVGTYFNQSAKMGAQSNNTSEGKDGGTVGQYIRVQRWGHNRTKHQRAKMGHGRVTLSSKCKQKLGTVGRYLLQRAEMGGTVGRFFDQSAKIGHSRMIFTLECKDGGICGQLLNKSVKMGARSDSN